MNNTEILQLKDMSIECLETMQAESIAVLAIESLNTMSDYFIIATARSSVHLSSTAEHLRVHCGKVFRKPRIEGLDSEWALIDFGVVVVHIMSATLRELYDLEGLWSSEMWQTEDE